VAEHPVCPERRFRYDYAWPEHHLALEVEGGVFSRQAHGSISGILRDIEKYNLGAVNGYRILRVLPRDLPTSATMDLIRRALG
jgi:hypothetical protein